MRIQRVLLVVAALLGLASLALSFSMRSSWPSTGGSAVATQVRDPIEEGIAFRESFGLQADRDFVKRMEANPSANRRFGVALTEDEASHLRGREERVLAIIDGLTAELRQEAAFAGLFIDQRAQGQVVVRTTADPAVVETMLKRYAQSGVSFRVERVQYGMTELEAVQRAVEADIQSLFRDGIHVGAVHVDPRSNRVVLSVVDLNDQKRALLAARYGPKLEILDGEAPEPMTGID